MTERLYVIADVRSLDWPVPDDPRVRGAVNDIAFLASRIERAYGQPTRYPHLSAILSRTLEHVRADHQRVGAAGVGPDGEELHYATMTDALVACTGERVEDIYGHWLDFLYAYGVTAATLQWETADETLRDVDFFAVVDYLDAVKDAEFDAQALVAERTAEAAQHALRMLRMAEATTDAAEASAAVPHGWDRV